MQEEKSAPISVPTYSHKELMDAAGIAEADRPHVDYVVSQESGWCHTKWQGQIGYCPEEHTAVYGYHNASVGYGLCQSTPAIKMETAGADWKTNPVTQLKWCAEYAKQYGGWHAAAEFKRCTGMCYSPKVLRNVAKATPWF